MSLERGAAAIAQALLGSRQTQATVLAVVADVPTRHLFERVLDDERLTIAGDFNEGLAVAEGDPPDVAFIEIGIADGAGLALVHHLKAIVPSLTVFALATEELVEQGAHAMALGAAGTILLPLGGDEILSAVATVKVRLAERAASVDLERAALVYSRAAGWMARVAEMADAPNRGVAAERFVEILIESTQSVGAAVYLSAAEKSTELVRAAASVSLEEAPAFGREADVIEFARGRRLLAVPLSLRKLRVGQVLLEPPDGARSGRSISSLDVRSTAARVDGLVKLLSTQATTAFALLGERERAHGGAMKDPTSSAYSFGYYVDVAGREIDRARRYGRRFAIATVAYEPEAEGGPKLGPAEMADQILKAVRDTDALARVEEHEFHLLMPETDGLGAHACRRRVLARLSGERSQAVVPPGVLVGVATFPHDGPDLAQLLRTARRRADAMKGSIVQTLPAEVSSTASILEAIGREVGDAVDAAPRRDSKPRAAPDVFAPHAFDLPTSEAVALATSAVADAMRGGATFIAVASHPNLSLGAAVRAAIGPSRDGVTLMSIDVKPGPDTSIEAVSVVGEHGAYALLARNEGGVVRGVHAADPLLADFLAERMGRAAGLRVFP